MEYHIKFFDDQLSFSIYIKYSAVSPSVAWTWGWVCCYIKEKLHVNIRLLSCTGPWFLSAWPVHGNHCTMTLLQSQEVPSLQWCLIILKKTYSIQNHHKIFQTVGKQWHILCVVVSVFVNVNERCGFEWMCVKNLQNWKQSHNLNSRHAVT